jgi:hypothetical protein
MIALLPLNDFLKTRKKVFLRYLPPFAVALLFLVIAICIKLCPDIDLIDIFNNFVSVQIGAIAVLISFSIAIITILVSSNNINIEALKDETATGYKELDGNGINLFQVILSNITYGTWIQVVYVAVLLIELLIQVGIEEYMVKYLIAIDIFFLVHIFDILIESIVFMYLTVWKNRKGEYEHK